MMGKRTQFPIVSIIKSLLLLLPLAGIAEAASFTDYRERIHQATTTLEQLETPDYFSDHTGQRDDFIKLRIRYLESLLPEKETVILNGQEIEVDNSWLHDALTDYEKNRNSSERATAIVVGIEQR